MSTSTMKAVAVFPEEREVRVVEHPEPKLARPSDVKIRMLEVGICGTDREICSFEYGTPPPDSRYLVLGHESLGQVVETGRDVQHLRPGDLVVPMVRRPCAHETCPACRKERQDFCFTGDFTERGIKQEHGFMTEYVVDAERYMVPVPHLLREVAILIEPLTIAEKALMQVWEVQQRLPWACEVRAGRDRDWCHTAVVLGAGPVGLLGAMALRAAGFRVFVYSREPKPNPKSAVVEGFGGTYVSAQDMPVEGLRELAGNIDLVYEAVGASRVAFDALKVLGTNGVFVFTGVPGRKGPQPVDTDLLMRHLVLRNQVVFGTVNSGRDGFEAAICDLELFMRKWPESVRALVTGRRRMDAYRELLLGAAGGIKNVLQIG